MNERARIYSNSYRQINATTTPPAAGPPRYYGNHNHELRMTIVESIIIGCGRSTNFFLVTLLLPSATVFAARDSTITMIAPNDSGCGGAHNAEEAECQRLLALLRRITTDTNNSNANAASVSSSSSAPSGAAAFIFSNHNYLLNEDDTASLLSYLAKLRCCSLFSIRTRNS